MTNSNELLHLRLLREELYDLDIEDIQNDLIDQRIFSQADCKEILEEPNEDHRLDLIFTILEHKVHSGRIMIVKDFLDVLKPYYGWIVDRHDEDVKGGISGPISRYLSYRNNTTVPNIDELNVYRREQLWQIQKYLKQLQHGVRGQRYLFVYGGFGTGKWTLVSQACENFTIVERMGYNIFYLNLANCKEPEQILELLENLSIQMESDYKLDDVTYNGRYPTNEIYLRKRRLLQLFEERFKNCLLILSHVREPELIASFDLKCKTLVITSNYDVVTSVNENERFVVTLRPGFTEDESMELFGKALRLKSDHLPSEAHEIHRTCKGNPFVIKLIARKMSEYGNAYNNVSNEHMVKIWSKLANELTRRTITIENMTIKSILQQLSAVEQKAFGSLVVFRDNVKIPPSVLQRYWALSAEQTETMAAKLINKGLLEKRCKDQQVFYVLHYVCYSFLLKENQVENYANLHRRLVESYRISEALQNRVELDLPKLFPNDNYFHFYIANHLEQSGMYNLFPDLFLDFGFLEQKLRYTGLPNTVGDLRHYQNRIFARIHEPALYAEALTEFLMRAEVLLSKSADACLLQLAINCTGLISTEAKIQANRYDNRVWFDDIDHNHQHQLVQIRSTPIKVRFQDPGSALVSLDNNQISLVDLSPWYSAPATIFDGNQGRVLDMQITNNVLVALDEEGTLNVWSMKNIPLDRNARQPESDGSFRRRIQCLRPHDPNDRFVSFCIISKKAVNNSISEIFAITQNGCLHIYNGLSNFTENTRCNTKIKDTYIIKPLVDHPGRIPKMLLVTENNQGCIFNLNTTSVEYHFEEPPVVNIHYMGNALVSVGSNQIRLRTFSRNQRNQPQTERLETIYETPAHHRNTCSAISDDYEYVILGTTQGISIFSIRDHVEVLRTNISHNILDVDIFSLDDDQYRYILISTSEESGNVINMYSLMVTANNQLVANQYQLDGNANFLADLDIDPVIVRTIDRKRIIQGLQFTMFQDREDFHKLTPLIENRALASEVNRLIQCQAGFYVGLNNGDVLRFSEWCNAKEGTKPEILLSLGRPINVLKYFEQLQALVVATEKSCIIWIEGVSELEIEAEICECYLFRNRYLVLICENCAVKIVNVQTWEIEYRLDHSLTYGASTFNDQYLIICTTNGAIRQLGIYFDDNDQLEIRVLHVYGQPEDAPLMRISSCVLSAHGELLAVGYKKGAIEVYNMEERKLIATLESHKSAVASLYFSPWEDPNSPHILVSIGEQIVFWSLNYVINNPRLDSKDFKRRSNRYKSRPSLTSPAIDIHHSTYGSRSSGLASPLAASPARNGTSFTFDIDEAGLQWLSKVGPSNKPQLLSCIKLIGSAEKLIINRDFNKFFTIDDEGHIYFLRLYQPDRNQLMISLESPKTPNGSSFHI